MFTICGRGGVVVHVFNITNILMYTVQKTINIIIVTLTYIQLFNIPLYSV